MQKLIEYRRQNVISFYQPRDMSAKVARNGIIYCIL